MKTFIKHRWKVIFGLLAFLYLLLGVELYLTQLEVGNKLNICPSEVTRLPMQPPLQEPNTQLCRPVHEQFDLSEMFFTVFFLPLIIVMITGTISFVLPIFGLFALDKLWHAKIRTLALIPFASTLSILFLTISLYFPVTIHNPDQFKNIQFGLPMKFILQSQNYWPDLFPYTTHFSSVLENPTTHLKIPPLRWNR